MCLQLGQQELGHWVYALLQMLLPIPHGQTHKPGQLLYRSYCIKLNGFFS